MWAWSFVALLAIAAATDPPAPEIFSDGAMIAVAASDFELRLTDGSTVGLAALAAAGSDATTRVAALETRVLTLETQLRAASAAIAEQGRQINALLAALTATNTNLANFNDTTTQQFDALKIELAETNGAITAVNATHSDQIGGLQNALGRTNSDLVAVNGTAARRIDGVAASVSQQNTTVTQLVLGVNQTCTGLNAAVLSFAATEINKTNTALGVLNTTAVAPNTGRISQVIACGTTGLVYNGSACVPTTVITCNAAPVVPNGASSGFSLFSLLGATLPVTCNSGYGLQGAAATARCLLSGTWAVPACLACPANCVRCDASATCQACASVYYLVSGACLLPESCKQAVTMGAVTLTSSANVNLAVKGTQRVVLARCTVDNGRYYTAIACTDLNQAASCVSSSKSTDADTCKAYGYNITPYRSANHYYDLGNRFGFSADFFSCLGVSRPSNGGSYTGCAMKRGSGSCDDWKPFDNGDWWVRDSAYSEPNGDYMAYCWLGQSSWPSSSGAGEITFNDAGSSTCNYATTKYVCTTTDS